MEKEIVKRGFSEAQKESEEKQVKQVKEIVTKTLEKLDKVKKEIKKLQDEEKVLKMDIDDLKEGRLDRISERQEKDPETKKVSVVVIVKEKEVIREVSPWYWPYQVYWQYVPPPVTYTNTINNNGFTGNNSYDFFAGTGMVDKTTTMLSSGDMINCSVAKNATIGAYDISGHIVHLR